MSVQTEIHNRLAGEIVASIVRPPLDAGGSFTDVLVLLESVIFGVTLAAVKLGGDEAVLDLVMMRVKERACMARRARVRQVTDTSGVQDVMVRLVEVMAERDAAEAEAQKLRAELDALRRKHATRPDWYEGELRGGDESQKLRAERDEFKALLNGRDDFIVSRGLWMDFVGTLPGAKAWSRLAEFQEGLRQAFAGCKAVKVKRAKHGGGA